ncbi:conjugative relaxase [Geomonas limicola]|uniref:Conjugative relaxase n=1 Tax=Geomonas limicola TaxID=2740186 RepID=A0A6V8N7E3_9BACT|nr:MobF family relaxase [Geomonas limicola]GFO67219.1 conjugative relaxase [Geomonas limicola]
MLSMSPAMAAVQAGGYFSREDYYLREAEIGQNSRWCGGGARALGLVDAVGEEDFRRICRGEDREGNRIVAYNLSGGVEGGRHRAGNDCTFSAPKSVSIAYAVGVDAVKEAHDAAVVAIAGQLERHHSLFRERGELFPGTLVAAKFDHATSRNIDPQLHSHLFVANLTQTPEGAWKANEPKGIYQNKMHLGFLYRVELARELEARGFSFRITDRSQMFFELKGIDPRLVDYFSSRRVEIEGQVANWREEGRFVGVPHGRLYEMAALETRDPKRSISREDVERIFEKGFEACGTSSLQVKEELEREIGLSPELAPRTAPEQMVELAARDLTEKEAVFGRERLLDQAVRISGTAYGVRELDEAIGSRAGVLSLGSDSRGREFFTTTGMRDLEAGNLERVKTLSRTPYESGVPPHEIEAYRERLASEGVRLTAGQWKEVLQEVTGESAFALTVGDPGTAKTGTLGYIERFYEEVLKPAGRAPCTINLAYTGKAAREMSAATGRPGFTLDSFLGAASKFDLQRPNSAGAILDIAGEKIPILKEAPLVLRLDEAGFVGARQAHELMDVVGRFQEHGLKVKVHLLGDTKQMQPIAAGNFLAQVRELGEAGKVEYAHLTEILRQRDPELKEIARGLNREDRPLAENAREALSRLKGRGELVEIPDHAELRSAAVRHYLEESRKPARHPERAAAGERQSVLMVAGTNAEKTELNREVREARVAAGEIERGKTFAVLTPVHQGVTVEGYREGDTLVFTGTQGEDGKLANWGARIGTEARVVALDRERNAVQVKYSFRAGRKGGEVVRHVTREFPAAELVGKTALFREEERNFAVGDRVVALKNDRGLKLNNGDLGTLRELDGEGGAVLDLGGRKVKLDLARYRQVDHAYAVTIHKSQGATVEHSIMVAPVRPGKETPLPATGDIAYGHTSYNALNVAVTRAQFGTRIFTTSKEGLAREVEVVDTKGSTLDKVVRESRELGPFGRAELFRERPLTVLGKEIDTLGKSLAKSGDGMPRLSVESIGIPHTPVPYRELFKPVLQPQMSIPKEPRLPDMGKELELRR